MCKRNARANRVFGTFDLVSFFSFWYVDLVVGVAIRSENLVVRAYYKVTVPTR